MIGSSVRLCYFNRLFVGISSVYIRVRYRLNVYIRAHETTNGIFSVLKCGQELFFIRRVRTFSTSVYCFNTFL